PLSAPPRTSSRLAALAQDTPALTGGERAPDAVLLAGGQRVLEAGFPDRAQGADRLGFVRPGVVVDGVEDLGIDATASRQVAPRATHQVTVLVSRRSAPVRSLVASLVERNREGICATTLQSAAIPRYLSTKWERIGRSRVGRARGTYPVRP